MADYEKIYQFTNDYDELEYHTAFTLSLEKLSQGLQNEQKQVLNDYEVQFIEAMPEGRNVKIEVKTFRDLTKPKVGQLNREINDVIVQAATIGDKLFLQPTQKLQLIEPTSRTPNQNAATIETMN